MSYNISDSEASQIKDALEKITDKVKEGIEPIASIQAQLLELQQKAARRPGGYDQGGGGQTIDVIVKKISSDGAVKALANGSTKATATIQLEGGIKAALTNTGYAGELQRLPGFGADPRRRLRLLDVLPHSPMNSGAAQYLRLNGYINAAGYQLVQGDLKNEAALPTELITAEASTVAHWLPCSTQILDDAPALEQQIRNLLLFGLADKLERELINGAGTAGTIPGMTGAAAAYTATAEAPADKVGEAAAELATRGWFPSVVILNPLDWFRITSERGSTGEYVAGGWNVAAGSTVWELDRVLSSAQTLGSALVLDAQQVAVLDRQQAAVDIGYTNDQFVRNLLTIRAELRATLAIYSPTALLEVALT